MILGYAECNAPNTTFCNGGCIDIKEPCGTICVDALWYCNGECIDKDDPCGQRCRDENKWTCKGVCISRALEVI